jgi:serine/threonine protein phosphatase PrpC
MSESGEPDRDPVTAVALAPEAPATDGAPPASLAADPAATTAATPPRVEGTATDASVSAIPAPQAPAEGSSASSSDGAASATGSASPEPSATTMETRAPTDTPAPTETPASTNPFAGSSSPEGPAGSIASPSSRVSPPRSVEVRVFGRTDVGMIREHNEDNFLIADLTQRLRSVKPEIRRHTIGERGSLFAVCDGMGGAAAGEVASQMAVDTVHELLQGAAAPTSKDAFARRISEAISEAGARIYLAAKANRAQRGMGTTSTVAGVYDGTLFLGQVGDSRAYLVRGGKIKQLTRDQSLVAKLIEAGQLTEEEAENYEHGHIILQALGTADTVDVDLSFLDLREGDALLLCSDGLCGLVNSGQMLEVLSSTDEPMECCKRLTDLANAAGGHDNITVIVARFGGDLPPVGGADAVFGYQPWVLASLPPEERDDRVPLQIKGADAPPPGKDVKNAISLRPTPVGAESDTRAGGSRHDDEESLSPPMTKTPQYVLAAFLVALAVGLILAAAYVLK